LQVATTDSIVFTKDGKKSLYLAIRKRDADISKILRSIGKILEITRRTEVDTFLEDRVSHGMKGLLVFAHMLDWLQNKLKISRIHTFVFKV
jgi:hypothetical protein